MNSKKTLILWLLIAISSLSNALAQTDYYYFQNQKVTKIKKYAKQELMFSKTFIERENEKKDSVASIAPLVTYVATNFLVPYAVKNVPKLFYKPEKYIKEHGKNYSFLNDKNNNLENSFNYQKAMTYKTVLYDTINNKLIEDEALNLNFNIVQIEVNRQNTKDTFSYLELVKYSYKYSPVKLKGAAGKVNLLVEVNFQYFDYNGQLQTHKTQPISISEKVPDGKESFKNQKKNITVLPKMTFVTGVEVKVTEVNSRKKDMDKWLEFYTSNNDKLQSFLVKKIEGE